MSIIDRIILIIDQTKKGNLSPLTKPDAGRYISKLTTLDTGTYILK